MKIGGDCEVVFKSEDISVCHRVGRKVEGGARRRPRDVLCRFVTRATKMAMMSNKKKLKEKEGYKDVYINENLTPMRAKLFATVRKCQNVKSAFTSQGKIICFLNDGTRHAIESPDDLFKLGFDEINYKDFGLDAYTVPTELE